MTEPAGLTPVGDRLQEVFDGVFHRGTTHSAGCAGWHSWCAYAAGRAEALRQLAADLEDEASDIDALGVTPPWAAMYGLKVTSGAEAAVILRRAAELALRRAEGQPQTPAAAGASRAPQPPGSGGNDNYGTEETRP